MNSARNRVLELVVEAGEKSSEKFELEYEEFKEDARLFGPSGVLDSLDLVSFVITLEDLIKEEFNTTVIISSDKAMSQKSSPFLSVKTVTNFVLELMNEGAEWKAL
jgi:acyl carrier protein